MLAAARSPENCPALVLNADFRPLSYFPLSLWSWQDAIKAVFLERVNILEEYDRTVHSPSFEMRLPSVVSLKTYIRPARNPAFTRFNVFLRDRFECQYCGAGEDLTFDHVIPRSRGGRTTWDNVVTACAPCNLLKGGQAAASFRNACRASARTGPPSTSCATTAGASRRTICTTAGRTISTGIPNWNPEPAATSVSRTALPRRDVAPRDKTPRARRASCSSDWSFPDRPASPCRRCA